MYEESTKDENRVEIQFRFSGAEIKEKTKDYIIGILKEIPYGAEVKVKITKKERGGDIEKSCPYFGDMEVEVFKNLIKHNIESAKELVISWDETNLEEEQE